MIGIDFDNTIVCYDGLIHRAARRFDLVPDNVEPTKSAVRDHLRAVGREDDWTELQGYVYGPGLAEAEAFPGVMEFFAAARQAGLDVAIISHKTLYPYRGERHNLHQAARDWLARQGFHDPARLGLPEDRVFLELTKEAKIERIRAVGCRTFIDDLPEFLSEASFPARVDRVLFDPGRLYGNVPGLRSFASWPEIAADLLPSAVRAGGC